MTPWLRILSDVHYGHPASQILNLGGLRPIVADVPTVWNGDSVEAQHERTDPADRARADLFRAHVTGLGTPARILTGNHDPDVSPHHEFLLGEGRVWVTHGDVLYDAIVPWGRNGARMEAALRRRLAGRPADLRERFTAVREVCTMVRHQPAGRGVVTGLFVRLIELAFPPTRTWRMLRAWTGSPRLACELAAAHRPQAQVIILGHTHLPGAWQTTRGTWVLNTGSFSPPFGPRIVELVPGAVRLRAIERRRGQWHPARVLREIPIDITP